MDALYLLSYKGRYAYLKHDIQFAIYKGKSQDSKALLLADLLSGRVLFAKERKRLSRMRQPVSKMERIKGVEPSCSAWEADVLPMNYTRRYGV